MSDGGIESLCCQVQIRDKVSSDTADQESCLSGNTTGNGTSGSNGSGGNHGDIENKVFVDILISVIFHYKIQFIKVETCLLIPQRTERMVL